jgi:hypothetical protein
MNRDCSLPQVRSDLPNGDRKARPNVLRVTDRYRYSIHVRGNGLTGGRVECDDQASARCVMAATGANAIQSRWLTS